METKIEYQLSPEMAEKLAVEQAMFQVSELQKNRWLFPLLSGIVITTFFGLGEFKFQISDSDYSTIARIIKALLVFTLGFGGGYLFDSLVRTNVSDRARKQARVDLQKLGTTKTVSWDSKVLVVSTPTWRAEIDWQVIDGLKNGEIGIHLVSGGRIIWGIPKALLPPNLSANDLIETWQRCFCKPPKLS